MSEPNRCQQCGSLLPEEDGIVGGCPSCMLELGFESWDGSAERLESGIAPASEQGAMALSRPETIGRYRLLRLIGEGGMGSVYEAEQDHPRRTVALKIIKPAVATPDLLRRFEQESQALGRLQHPGIAQIYEAGTVDTGFGPQPYFAMEFIRGLPPRNYAETHHLNTRARLQIMAKICDGVHHAHQRGLIHRDLKPGNILIDETGQPKILDFGVARVIDSDARATLQTDVGQLVGTLAYMSPEQALADPLDIDTRTDVYALGVILYELLSGQLPYAISKKIHETIQTIREQDPARLSAVNRACRGDIETIVARALEKDRSRRYASAAEMAADIQRYLNDEPIVARPQSTSYQLRKFARRHRSLVTGVAAVFAVLVAGIAASTWQAGEAVRERDRALRAEEQTRQQRDRALEATERALRAEERARQQSDLAVSREQEASSERDNAVAAKEQVRGERDRAIAEQQRADMAADTATELNDFLGKLLTLPDPRIGTELEVLVKANPNLTFREVLDRAAASIDGKFTRPLVEAKLREFIAVSYRSIGLFAEAQSQFERALELHRREQGRAHPDSLKALKALSELARRAVFSTSYLEALQQEILDIEIQTLGKEHPETLMSMDRQIMLYLSQQKYAEVEPLLVNILAARSRIAGPTDLTSVRYTVFLIESYEKLGKSEKARQLMEKLESVFRVLGEGNDITQAGLGMLAEFYLDNFWTRPEAEALFNRTLKLRLSRISAMSNVEAISAMSILVQAYQQLGKSEQADQLSVMVEAKLRGLGETNPIMIAGVNFYKLRTGRSLPDLVDLANAALPRTGAESLRDISTIKEVARAYYDQGKYEEAQRLYTRAVDVYGRLLAKEDPDSLATRMALAGLYVLESKHDQAEESFKDLVNINRRASGPEARITLLTMTLLGWSRLHQQKYVEVEAGLRDVLGSLEKTQPEEWERYNCQSILGASLAGQKRFAEAEPLLLSAYGGMTTRQSTVARAYPMRPKLHEEGGERIVRLYEDWGKPEKAAEWREKLRAAEAAAVFEPLRK